ncbi:unnamed protein product [Brassica oleracea]
MICLPLTGISGNVLPWISAPSMGSQQQQSTAVICNTYAAWDKERKRAGLVWTFSGTSPPTAMEETLVQEFVGSPLMAEALAVRAAL